ncbi:MAG: DJ-1/PfpI family protein [candidate division WOR-3 bacterium]
MKKVLFIIAKQGFRDEEYFIPKSILEEKFEVKTASNSKEKSIALGFLGGEAEVDINYEDINVDDFDAIIFVGGQGALKNLDNEISYKIAQEAINKNKILCAICIAPVILAKAGVLKDKKATVWHSNFDKAPIKILEENGAIFVDEDVVEDGNIITANGPNAAEEFGKKILKKLES